MPNDYQVNMPRRMTLPLEFHDNTPFLIGTLNGKPCRFIMDSGAQDITLNARYAQAEAGADSIDVMGFTGQVKSHSVELGELALGDWRFASREVLTMDMTHMEEADAFGVPVHGLIGFRQLIHFDWMVDYDKAEFHLWDRFPEAEYKIAQKLRCRYFHHLPLVEVEIAAQKFKLLVDTGAPELVFDQEKKDLILHEIDLREPEKMASGSPVKFDVIPGTLSGFKYGELDFGELEIKLSDMTGLQRAFGDIDGIFGYGMLSQYRTVVCWNTHRMYFLEK